MDNFIDKKFLLGKKWFCVGIAVGFFSVFAGLIYGIALALEKEERKKGLIIIAFSIIWKILLTFFIFPALAKYGLLSFYLIYINI